MWSQPTYSSWFYNEHTLNIQVTTGPISTTGADKNNLSYKSLWETNTTLGDGDTKMN